MTLARVRRPTCAARPAAWKASPSTYTPPWKYRTVWRGSTPSTVISAAGTPPSAAAVTVTPAGSGCADTSSRSSRRCPLTSMPAGKADCRRIASRVSRCSVLTEELPSFGVSVAAPPGGLSHVNPLLKFPAGEAGHYQACRQAGEEASPDHGDSRDRSTAEPTFHGQPECAGSGQSLPSPWIALLCVPVTARLPTPAIRPSSRAAAIAASWASQRASARGGEGVHLPQGQERRAGLGGPG